MENEEKSKDLFSLMGELIQGMKAIVQIQEKLSASFDQFQAEQSRAAQALGKRD